jgi:hypothetical protein
MSAMAGNEPYFEEAARALFAGDKERSDQIVEPSPIDITDYAKKLDGSEWMGPNGVRMGPNGPNGDGEIWRCNIFCVNCFLVVWQMVSAVSFLGMT